MKNHLQHETSPYLLEHAENPVDWYPWGEEAFERARQEDKPVFVSIGYSTCHWCHVMARESFEDEEIADILNRHFISIKVDREERPDIDSIYMAACQAFTGSGGWPASIFMTADQKPFFAGTYFPPRARGRYMGLQELLEFLGDKWENDRDALLRQAEEIVEQLEQGTAGGSAAGADLLDAAVALYKRSYDGKNGGFGRAPKFPAPHNLLFLLDCHQRRGDAQCLEMAERTLMQMYRGGLFDHVGFGFCRYSTDERFLLPHFEKMLYDNALLILAYCRAYEVTKKELYRDIAEKTAAFLLREMCSPEGGFYSAQDADSEGEEGKYYLFTPQEILTLLGEEDGETFNRCFGITASGHLGGKSVPNRLGSEGTQEVPNALLEQVYRYRRERYPLHTDDKILFAWNSLAIAALCRLYQNSGKRVYLDAARRADDFLWEHLQENGVLYVSYRLGKRGTRGFLDDYASCLFAQLALYRSTLLPSYLERAQSVCRAVLECFQDRENGGFYLYGEESETLILRPKESYDGAMPSGNALMAWDLVQLAQLLPEEGYEPEAQHQLAFLAAQAAAYPPGFSMFLLAQLAFDEPPMKVTAVLAEPEEADKLPLSFPPEAVLRLLRGPTEAYALKNEKTTFYICRDRSCLPPTNEVPV